MSESNGRRFLSREDIQSIQLKTAVVDLPEWGEGAAVTVREMKAGEAVALRAFNGTDQNARMAAMVMLAEDGSPLFDYNNTEHIHILVNKGASGIQKICLAALKLSGKTEEEVYEAIKNSEASPSTVSVSA